MADIKNDFSTETDNKIDKSNQDTVNYNDKPAVLILKKSNNAGQNATIGTVYTYTCSIENNGGSSANSVKFSDILASNIQYVANSFKVDGVAKVPTVAGQTLTYLIASIPAGTTAVVTFDVKILS